MAITDTSTSVMISAKIHFSERMGIALGGGELRKVERWFGLDSCEHDKLLAFQVIEQDLVDRRREQRLEDAEERRAQTHKEFGILLPSMSAQQREDLKGIKAFEEAFVIQSLEDLVGIEKLREAQIRFVDYQKLRRHFSKALLATNPVNERIRLADKNGPFQPEILDMAVPYPMFRQHLKSLGGAIEETGRTPIGAEFQVMPAYSIYQPSKS